MVMDINYTYCGDHFTAYTNAESCCTLGTNVLLYASHTTLKSVTKNYSPFFFLKKQKI